MARDFDGTTQYLALGTAVATGQATFAAWFRPDTTSGAHAICMIGDTSIASAEYGILQVNNQFWALSQGVTNFQAIATATLAAGTWYHGCGTFVSDGERHAYVNGGSKGDNYSSIGVSGLTGTRIGQRASTTDQKFAGAVAEVAIWDTILSDAEIFWVSRGYSPLMLYGRLANLVAYWPLLAASGGDEPDMARGHKYSMTLVNGPTAAQHPQIFRPLSSSKSVLAAFAGGAIPPGAARVPRPGSTMLGGVAMV